MKPGDLIVAYNPKSKYLTHGRIYIVKPNNSLIYSNCYLFLADDSGKVKPYGKKNFIPLSEWQKHAETLNTLSL